MSCEIPRMHPEKPPATPIFNIGILATHEVQLLGRALYSAYDSECDSETMRKKDDKGPTEHRWVYSKMINSLRDSVSGLAKSNPQRGREILLHLSASDDPYDVELSAEVAPAFLQTDYELATDVLIRASASRHPDAWEAARSIIHDVLDGRRGLFEVEREDLTSEQVADFKERLRRAGHDV